jgi:outer membrane protein
VVSGLAQVRALQTAERSARTLLESNLLGYQIGVRIDIDVLNAQDHLFSARRDLAKGRTALAVQCALLATTGHTATLPRAQ